MVAQFGAKVVVNATHREVVGEGWESNAPPLLFAEPIQSMLSPEQFSQKRSAVLPVPCFFQPVQKAWMQGM